MLKKLLTNSLAQQFSWADHLQIRKRKKRNSVYIIK